MRDHRRPRALVLIPFQQAPSVILEHIAGTVADASVNDQLLRSVRTTELLVTYAVALAGRPIMS